MHILFLSDNFPPETNAPATRLCEHAREWVRLGHRVTVVTCAPNFPDGVLHAGYANCWHQRERLDGIEVVRVKTYIAPNRGFLRRTLDYLSFLATATPAALLQRSPDLVVATSPQFFATLAGWLVAALRRKPFVFELRDLWPASITAVGAMRKGFATRLLERLELFLYRRAALVIALTESFRRDLVARGIPEAKIRVVTNGADLSRYRPAARDELLARSLDLRDRFVVGYLGTHGLAHALEHVLDAAEILRHRPEVRFLFVGSGAAKDALVTSARARDLTNVVFLPPQPKAAMPAIWSLCDAALVHLRDTPLFRTVIPSKIFEAMAMGVPTLFSGPDGETASIVRRTSCGLALPPADPAALASSIERLLDEPGLAQRLSASALAAAPAFDRAELAREMLRCFEQALHGEPVPEVRLAPSEPAPPPAAAARPALPVRSGARAPSS
ncbi:MAG TPA: glycosyltransferase family 4 protein [Planctomycetota bacterium]|nr:glycosyltransferase family 4 protein [Planctomycetota bacterium]